MINKFAFFPLLLVSFSGLASKTIHLHQDNLSSLKNFQMIDRQEKRTSLVSPINTLEPISATLSGNQSIVRYQQFYKTIRVAGAQIMMSKENNKDPIINGQLIDEIQLSTKPDITEQKAISIAKNAHLMFHPNARFSDENSQLEIRQQAENSLNLVYLVSFKTTKENNKPAWLFFIIDAQTGEITKQWNNVKSYLDSGPGGNEKVHEYWYGRDGLPPLEVIQMGAYCVLESPKVKLVDVHSTWDWANELSNPSVYLCDNNVEESVNGAFSPSNDAYYFGHVIVDMYRNWYHLNALQKPTGEASQLVMRVHFGQYFDNAFWDGQTMSFGDGYELYPLVSLDVAGHEVTHGFTEQHSNLEYHDESGALNESVSDMAGQAARAYLLETQPKLYNRSNLVPDSVTWGIGESIMRGAESAIRYMNSPSMDGSSADCLNEKLAKLNGASCKLNYRDIVNYAEQRISDPEERQSFIVHSASGIFNKAFYLISNQIGIKKAYQAMVLANIKYWTPTTDFLSGACGVLYAANDLKMDLTPFIVGFAQVGVETSICRI